ncbi:hypothetical protein OUZ56_017163 [Daphnia magna]|uniref:Uncharacterized protein n=1 Tax=Daphnia magna TaxID=35525 RepID=A0ABR0ASG4_9CRUS|nr:hypothetical protein OUZ56_017163 [Daphnia magna]
MMEVGQINMTTQLATITQHLATLIGVPPPPPAPGAGVSQVVEIVLGIVPTTPTTPNDELDLIANYVRGKRNVALDRVAFEEHRQGLANHTTTRIMAGIRDSETKKKLLALSPFPTTQAAVNLCKSEESARTNEKVLSSQTGVASIQTKLSPNRKEKVSLRPTASYSLSCATSGGHKTQLQPK